MYFIEIITVLFIATSSPASAATPYALKTPPLTTNWTSLVGTSPWSSYPRPQLARPDWLSLNGPWQWEAASGPESLDAPPFGRNLSSEILVPFCVESGLSGVMQSRQYYSWYRKEVEVPGNWSALGRVLVNFGAVDNEATIFINGQNASFHRGGYSRFSVDMTPYLNNGTAAEILVFVFDPTESGDNLIPLGKQTINPSHIFYTACTGIWQSVFIEPVPQTYVTRLDITGSMQGAVNATVHASATAPVSIAIKTAEGNTVAAGSGTAGTPFSFSVPSPSLWSAASPVLYKVTVTLSDDIVESYIGFRTVSKGKVNGITRPLINGVFEFQFGTLDQGYWPDGIYTAPSEEAMRFDLQTLKTLGFNMVRKHIKVEPDLFYYACDCLGLYVWQDMPSLSISHPLPSVTQQAEFTRQLELLVNNHLSFPSIVTWVIYNEGWGQPGSAEVGLTQLVKSLDPTRLVNSATGWHDHGAGDFSDNHHYPSPQCGSPFYSTPSSPYDAARIGVQGEFGGIGHNVSIDHLWNVQQAIDGINQTYEMDADLDTWNYRTLLVLEELRQQIERYACSAAVYTETADVEGEVNGLLTYDRRLLRPDVARWQAATSALYSTAANRTGGVTVARFASPSFAELGPRPQAAQGLDSFGTAADPALRGSVRDAELATTKSFGKRLRDHMAKSSRRAGRN